MAPSKEWRAFAKKHKGNPWLRLDPLYALPKKLLDALEKYPGAMKLVRPKDLLFEQELTKAADGGFFMERPFASVIDPAPLKDPVDTKMSKRISKSQRDLRDLQIRDLVDGGVHKRHAATIVDGQDANRGLYDMRARAYAGWLVANPRFRAERDGARSEWGAAVKESGVFPVVATENLGPFYTPKPLWTDRKAWAECSAFFKRWCLQSMVTWDLPVPLRVQSHGSNLEWIDEAGAVLFVPWYLLRDKKLSLHDVVDHLKKLSNPSHLASWLDGGNTPRDAAADVRWGNAFIIYCCLHLALVPRYSSRPGWSAAAFDKVFARYLRLGVDSIKKARLMLGPPR